MKLLRKASLIIVLTIVFSSTYQCSSSKAVTQSFEEPSSFEVKPVVFQEWYAGIKVGGTGMNVFVPVVDKPENVTLEKIYFRNLEGKLVEQGNKYLALLKNPSPYYTFEKPEKPADYPFDLNDEECVISYKENGVLKHMKIAQVHEVAGTYYENGPPTIYTPNKEVLASIDEEEE